MEAQRFQGELEGNASTGKVKKKKKKRCRLEKAICERRNGSGED